MSKTLFDDDFQAQVSAADELVIYVPAIPVAQPRAKAMSFGGHARVYQPRGPVDAFKATVKLAAQQVHRAKPMEGPLSVSLVLVFPRPQNMIWKTRAMPRVWHTKKPDRDNVDKAVLDALKGLLWIDDTQVCAGSIEKWIAAGDEQPHVLIKVKELA